MKRAGTLDTRIVLQRRSVTYSNTGDEIVSWADFATRWADYKPLVGSEVNLDSQWVAKEQVQFTIRYDRDVVTIIPLDRVVCPASDAGVSPEVTRSIYDIIAVQQPDLNDTLRIIAARRADVR